MNSTTLLWFISPRILRVRSSGVSSFSLTSPPLEMLALALAGARLVLESGVTEGRGPTWVARALVRAAASAPGIRARRV
jgi:hypothetical protein